MIPTTGINLDAGTWTDLGSSVTGVVNTIFNVGPKLITTFLPIMLAILVVGLIFYYVKKAVKSR